MPFSVFGVNHKSAPLEIRERLAVAEGQVPIMLQELTSFPGVNEALILSTCNRLEVYCTQEQPDPELPSRWLNDCHNLSADEIKPYLYHYTVEEAVRHVMRVACGLDSMVLGEPQILGQLKSAYNDAEKAGTTGKLLGRLLQHAFSVAKQVRTDTAIGSSPVSVAFAAVRLAQQIFGALENQTALLIGAGDTIELAARHMHEKKLKRMIIANRTLENAQHLASDFGAYAIALGDLPLHLAEADIVISSTASQLPILGKGAVEQALKARKRKPMFMVDIAVPRDIEPEIGQLDDVYLYTVDDLDSVIEENLSSRRAAAEQAEEIIDTEVNHFLDWMKSLNAVPTIRALRKHFEYTSSDLREKALKQLANGDDPQQVIDALTHTLINTLTHNPSVKLREAGTNADRELLLAAQRLFDLDLDK